MAIVEQNSKVNVNLVLNAGTTTTGAMKTSNLSIGSLSVDRIDNSKYMAIKDALSPILSLSTVGVRKTLQSMLTEE